MSEKEIARRIVDVRDSLRRELHRFAEELRMELRQATDQIEGAADRIENAVGGRWLSER
jgi:hypothetical protein